MNRIYRNEWHNSFGVYIGVIFSTALASFQFCWGGVGGAKFLNLGFAEAQDEWY
jgi:hypothetical protein